MYSLPGNAFKFTLGFDPLPLSRVRGELSREPIHVLVVVVAVCREFPTASSNKVGRRKELGEEEEGALILSVSCPTRIVKIQNKSGHYAFLSLSLSPNESTYHSSDTAFLTFHPSPCDHSFSPLYYRRFISLFPNPFWVLTSLFPFEIFKQPPFPSSLFHL